MRADLFLCDPHRIIVTGPSKLKGRKLDSRDLRSGMALIAAALAAEGQSRLSPLETVERGLRPARRSSQDAGRPGRAGGAKNAATSGLTTLPIAFLGS